MVIVALVSLIALFIFGVLYSRAEIELKYERRGTDDRVTIRLIGPFGIVYQRTEVPVMEFDAAKDGWRFELETRAKEEVGLNPSALSRSEFYIHEFNKVRHFISKLQRLKKTFEPMVDFILDHVVMRSLTWQTTLGVGDAAGTAVLCGSLWGIKGTLLSYVQSRTHVNDNSVVIAVFPSFREKGFQTFLQCIFSLRVVHIIGAQLIMLREKRRHKKGVTQDGQSSNSGPDENGHGKHQGHGGRQHHSG